MKRILKQVFLVTVLLFAFASFAFAKGGSVYVHGHTTKNGTYVAPYYRSAPDGNPYKNYSFPGNTNPYTGKIAGGNPDTYLNNYYNKSSGSTYMSPSPSYNTPSYSTSGSAKRIVTCSRGYKINYITNSCDQVIIPPNASLDYFGTDFVCNKGYKKNYTTNECNAVILPPNSQLDYFGSDFICNKGYEKNYLTNSCDAVQVPANASLDYFGSDFVCNKGFKRNYITNQCDTVVVPLHAHLDYFGSDFVCDSGYTRNYITNTCN